MGAGERAMRDGATRGAVLPHRGCLVAFVFVALAAAQTAYAQWVPLASWAAIKPQPAALSGTPPERATLRLERVGIEQPATVEQFEITPLVAKIPGYVESIAEDPAKAATALPGKQKPTIDIGSEVKVGQLLATLAVPVAAQEAKPGNSSSGSLSRRSSGLPRSSSTRALTSA